MATQIETQRAQVVRTIRVYRDTIADVCVHDAAWKARVRNEEPAAMAELLERACAQTGIAPAEYQAEIQADPSLIDLQRLALDELFVEPADPGPYSAISRESPSGTTENYHLHAWNGISPPGGVGGSGAAPKKR